MNTLSKNALIKNLMQATFYEIIVTTLEKTLPKLLEKIYEKGLKTVIRVESEERSKSISNTMWTYSTLSFLPHGSHLCPKEFQSFQPIWITSQEDNPINASILVITDQNTKNIKGYDRILDIYNGNEENAQQMAIERSKIYSSSGYAIDSWEQDLKGSWGKGKLS